jgi:hypothetical protein
VTFARPDPSACALDETGRCNPFAQDLHTIDIRQGTTKARSS